MLTQWWRLTDKLDQTWTALTLQAYSMKIQQKVVSYRIHALCALIGSLGATCWAAEITIENSPNRTPEIFLKGDINARTPGELETALKSVQKRIDANTADLERQRPVLKDKFVGLLGAYLDLDSRGGDVEAAIKAGTIGRNYGVHTLVGEHSSCASACALLLIGGVNRTVFGRVGIHRPFSTSYSTSFAEANERFKSITADVGKYLQSMNMAPRLMDEMNAVPPDQILWLTSSDLKELGIAGTDPVWQDRLDSVKSLSIGISKQEYYDREQQADARCQAGGELFAYMRCRDNIVNEVRQ